MKINFRYIRDPRWAAQRVLVFAVVSAVVVGSFAGFAIAQDGDPSEILDELQAKLELSDEQAQQVGAAMGKYAGELEATLAKHENAEEPDGAAMIGDVKKVRDAYRKELQTILSKEQYEGYIAMVEAILLEMMSDVAELALHPLVRINRI